MFQHIQKNIANISLIAILASIVALGIGLGVGMGLPWWATLALLCVAMVGIGLGMILAHKTNKYMRDWKPSAQNPQHLNEPDQHDQNNDSTTTH